MRIYLDNVIASAWVRRDLKPPEQQTALERIQGHPHFGSLEIVTSRESWREQDRTRDEGIREELRSSRDQMPVVSHDHIVLGFNNVDLGYRGFISSPLVTDIVDETIFNCLEALGLKPGDARHLMYALSNECVRFVTTDQDFAQRRAAIEQRYPTIHIVLPTELLEELESFK